MRQGAPAGALTIPPSVPQPEPVVFAFVLESNASVAAEFVTLWTIEKDGETESFQPLDPKISASYFDKMGDTLAAAGWFYPLSQTLFLLQSKDAWSFSNPIDVLMSLQISVGQQPPIPITRLTGCLTTLSDLNSLPLTNAVLFDFILDEPPIAIVPTVSESGLVIMTLLLLAGLTIRFARFGRRQEASSHRP